MTTELLALTQWLSPAFPLGSYAYSHGLETAISDGTVKDARTLAAWLETVLCAGGGWSDAVLLCAAQRGEEVSAIARAVAGSKERLEETEAQGRAFVDTLAELGHDIPPAPLPVAVGMATKAFDLPPATIAAIYLQSFASNLVSCAVRFVPLGQSEGQRVLAGLSETILELAERAAEAEIDDLATGAFFSDLSAMAHEAQSARIFRT
ncbi:MAG: urease accessory UreF family protein [Pseudomonadota bacterium]